MTSLTEEQLRFLNGSKRRMRFTKLNKLLAVAFTVALIASVWLCPLWYNPLAMGELTETGATHYRVLGSAAEMLPLVLILFWLVALVDILHRAMVIERDKQYLEIIITLQEEADAPSGQESPG